MSRQEIQYSTTVAVFLIYNAVKQFVLYLIYIYLCICAYMQKPSLYFYA